MQVYFAVYLGRLSKEVWGAGGVRTCQVQKACVRSRGCWKQFSKQTSPHVGLLWKLSTAGVGFLLNGTWTKQSIIKTEGECCCACVCLPVNVLTKYFLGHWTPITVTLRLYEPLKFKTSWLQRTQFGLSHITTDQSTRKHKSTHRNSQVQV